MTVINQPEFEKRWTEDTKKNGGRGFQFHLKKDEISEWKESGKFKVVKEFCESRGYEIFFCCMEGKNESDRYFGFMLENEHDTLKLINLVDELRETEFGDVQYVRVLGRSEKGGGWGGGCNAGANCPFSV